MGEKFGEFLVLYPAWYCMAVAVVWFLEPLWKKVGSK